jgi:hypothetical protein
MTRALVVSLPLAAVAAVLLAVPADTEAGFFRRRAHCCPAPCPPPCPCFCPAPWPGPYAPYPYPAAVVTPVPGTPAAVPPPAPRTIVSPKGRTYRLTPTGNRGREAPDEVTPPSPFTAADPNGFVGTSRRIAKTSYVEGNPMAYPSISKLRESLTPEETMLSLNIPWGPGSQNSDRVEQERRNVTVSAYLYAYKEEADHDYHVILGDAPDSPNRRFLNSEVSGLPTGGPYRAHLQQVRNKFKSFFDLGNTGPAAYVQVDPPLPVRVTGSIFYDMDHAPPRPYVGFGDFQPMVAWEIHPITEIEFDAEP